MEAPNNTNTNKDKDNDYNLYMSENGHLSFENPNYQGEGGLPLARIDAARMEDHLNSNIQPALPPSVFEELCQVYPYCIYVVEIFFCSRIINKRNLI